MAASAAPPLSQCESSVKPLSMGATAHALAAINGALFNRAMGGGGDHLDITLLDSYFHCHEMSVGVYSASAGKVAPRRSGSHQRIHRVVGGLERSPANDP